MPGTRRGRRMMRHLADKCGQFADIGKCGQTTPLSNPLSVCNADKLRTSCGQNGLRVAPALGGAPLALPEPPASPPAPASTPSGQPSLPPASWLLPALQVKERGSKSPLQTWKLRHSQGLRVALSTECPRLPAHLLALAGVGEICPLPAKNVRPRGVCRQFLGWKPCLPTLFSGAP